MLKAGQDIWINDDDDDVILRLVIQKKNSNENNQLLSHPEFLHSFSSLFLIH